jgi:hypothetical protein
LEGERQQLGKMALEIKLRLQWGHPEMRVTPATGKALAWARKSEDGSQSSLGEANTRLRRKAQLRHIEDARKAIGNSHRRHALVFEPDSKVLVARALVLFIICLAELYILPSRAGFLSLSRQWLYYDAAVYLLYVLDVALRLRTAYISDGIMISDPFRIARTYGGLGILWFVVDVACSLPISFFQLMPGLNPILAGFLPFVRYAGFKKPKYIPILSMG